MTTVGLPGGKRSGGGCGAHPPTMLTRSSRAASASMAAEGAALRSPERAAASVAVPEGLLPLRARAGGGGGARLAAAEVLRINGERRVVCGGGGEGHQRILRPGDAAQAAVQFQGIGRSGALCPEADRKGSSTFRGER